MPDGIGPVSMTIFGRPCLLAIVATDGSAEPGPERHVWLCCPPYLGCSSHDLLDAANQAETRLGLGLQANHIWASSAS